LILVDVFSQSLTITKEKEIKLVPINNLQSSKRGNMIIHVTSHLQRLRKILNKKGLTMDSLRRVLTLSYQSDDNVKLDETYDKCAMWVAPKTEIVSEDTMIVSLPPLNIIPEADGDSFAILSFLGENGSSKHALSLCIEERYESEFLGHKFLNIGYFGIIYSLPLLRINPAYGNTKYAEDDEIIEVKIEENRITYTSVESMLERYLLINYRDMTDMEFGEIWTPMDIRCVAPGAESGDVKSVKCLALCYEPRYTIGDMKEAKKIVGVAKSLYLSGASMPDDMGYYGMWSKLANSAAESEMEQFIFAGNSDDQEAMYEIENRSCDYHVGRLVTRAKKTGLMNIKFPEFSMFCQAVSDAVAGERNVCTEIGFKWNSASNTQEEVQELMEKIGWKKKENPDPQYDVVIVDYGQNPS